MFLIDANKPNIEKKFKTCIFYATVKGRGFRSVQNKINFVSFCDRFAGGNKNIIQKNEKFIYLG